MVYHLRFDLIKANEQGIWEKRFTIPTSAKYYTAYIASDVSLPVLHTSLSDKLGVLQTVYDNIFDNTDETAVNTLKTTLGFKSDEVINYVVLGLDTTTVTLENENVVLSLLVKAFERKFNKKMKIPVHLEEAAFGAALFSLVSCGIFKNMNDAQKIIKYKPV